MKNNRLFIVIALILTGLINLISGLLRNLLLGCLTGLALLAVAAVMLYGHALAKHREQTRGNEP
jgi:hypothetical protein